MIIKIIFGLRKQRYGGQLAPEVLDAFTEFDVEENPDFFQKTVDTWTQKLLEGNDWQAIKVIDIAVPQEKIVIRLLAKPALIGTVL